MVACNLPVFCVLDEIRHYHIIKYKQPHMCNPTENHRESLGVYCWTIWCKPFKKKKPSDPQHLHISLHILRTRTLWISSWTKKMRKWSSCISLWIYEFLFLTQRNEGYLSFGKYFLIRLGEKNVQNFDLSVAIG